MLAVMEDPHQLREASCTHTFCKACLEQALGAEGAARCPVCRAPAGEGAPATLVTRAVVTAAMIDSLEVHCAHGVRQAQGGEGEEAAWELRTDEGACRAVFPRGQLARHAAECCAATVACAQAGLGCDWSGARREAAGHAAGCWFAGREVGALAGRLRAEQASAAAGAQASARAELASGIAACRGAATLRSRPPARASGLALRGHLFI